MGFRRAGSNHVPAATEPAGTVEGKLLGALCNVDQPGGILNTHGHSSKGFRNKKLTVVRIQNLLKDGLARRSPFSQSALASRTDSTFLALGLCASRGLGPGARAAALTASQ